MNARRDYVVGFAEFPASAASFDRKSAKAGNSEAVVITSPVAGTYYMAVVGETAFVNVSVLGVY